MTPKLQAQMQDWLKQAQLGNLNKGLTFGAQTHNQFVQAGGVNYLASSGSAQTYQASSLVNR